MTCMLYDMAQEARGKKQEKTGIKQETETVLHTNIIKRIGVLTVDAHLKMAVIAEGFPGVTDISDDLPL